MNERPKELWLDLLTTSKQTVGALYNVEEGSYCCLGVLTQCYLDETGKTWDDVATLITDIYGLGTVLPEVVANWAGLSRTDPKLIVDGEEYWLSTLNDDCILNFKELAELIREQL